MEILKLKSLEKWKFQPILPWKSGNSGVKKLGKMENFGKNILEKWSFLPFSPWKSGNFGVKKLGKVEILSEICIEKWKFIGYSNILQKDKIL